MPIALRVADAPLPLPRLLEPSLVAGLALLVVLGGSVLQPTWRAVPFAAWIAIAAGVATWRIILDPRAFPATLLGLALAPLGVVLVQLCRIPSEWLSLSAGQVFAGSIRALVEPAATASISVDRVATASAAVPVAVFSATLLLLHVRPRRDWGSIFASFAILGSVGVILALAQFGSAGRWGDIYHSAQAANAPGFFANRNHGATFLACCLAFFGAWIGGQPIPWPRRYMLFAGASLFPLSIIALSGSRTGLMIGLVMAGATLLAFPRDRSEVRSIDPAMRFAGLFIIVGFGVIVALVSLNGDTSTRLSGVSGDLRWSIWAHARDLVLLYWPWGSGLGTFAHVYALIEPVGELHPFYINHAHNDFIELFVETGALAIVPIMAALLFGWASLATRAQYSRKVMLERRVATIVVAGLLAHSFVDYPLRTPTLAIVLAVALSVLTPGAGSASSAASKRSGLSALRFDQLDVALSK
ncbi:O-antigen ligase [uncultured Sphingomonas sp.]|uniref:O-antigen ligase family protein n=1 Tax=uncultured Sphingomonas sp. TaxID=158754 RepID=UPI0025FF2B86|nr:O-antigen ligase family protein [uncultured Sphingomonas sp.]